LDFKLRHYRRFVAGAGKGEGMIKIMAAFAAFLAVLFVSYRIALGTLASNRNAEMAQNERAGSLSEAQMHWTIVHIRDDIGAMHNLLVLTNALLAALLAAQIF
jgi:hypothetical protein